MNEKQHTDMLVGIFLLIGIIAITFLALRIGDFQLLNNQQYIIKAEFTSASGLKKGAHVEIAGVSVGGFNLLPMLCINLILFLILRLT